MLSNKKPGFTADAMEAYVAKSHPKDAEAYKANHEAFKGGQTKQEVANYYNHWAESGQYDVHLSPTRYTGPECAARVLASHFQENERANARVLDLAAGTGRLAAELHRLGFRCMDALDPSEGMLKKAKERGIYTNFFNDFIGDRHSVPVPDNAYDALGVSGGFGEGHIPVSALHEVARIVKPGGVIILVFREEYLVDVDSLLPAINRMEQDGIWKVAAKDIMENYAFEKNGVVIQLVVL